MCNYAFTEGYPTYEIGREHAARAELTSNIDSDQDEVKSRQKKKTKHYKSGAEEIEHEHIDSEDSNRNYFRIYTVVSIGAGNR